MVILGLTGSIGMGKTTAAGMFRYLGVPVYDLDAAVHTLLGPGGEAVAAVRNAFPDAVIHGAVDRKLLGEKVFGDPDSLKNLESILHPLVRQVRGTFIKQAAARREHIVVLDFPLLYETDGAKVCDAVIVVSAPRFLQEARVLARDGMTRAKFTGVLARQLPDYEKRRRADFIVPTGLGRALTLRRLKQIIRLIKSGHNAP